MVFAMIRVSEDSAPSVPSGFYRRMSISGYAGIHIGASQTNATSYERP